MNTFYAKSLVERFLDDMDDLDKGVVRNHRCQCDGDEIPGICPGPTNCPNSDAHEEEIEDDRITH